MKRFLCIIVLFIAFTGQSSGAGPWFQVAGGYGSYGLGEVTDAPTTYRGYQLESGSMDSGALLSLALGVDYERPWSLSIGYVRNWANTTGLSDAAQLDADLPVHVFRATTAWFPLRRDHARFGAGGGLGIASLRGAVETTGSPFGGLQGDVESAALFAEGFLVGEVDLTASLGFQVHGGYRRMSFDEATVEGIPLERDDNQEVVAFDYSGWYVQAGLKIAMPVGQGAI